MIARSLLVLCALVSVTGCGRQPPSQDAQASLEAQQSPSAQEPADAPLAIAAGEAPLPPPPEMSPTYLSQQPAMAMPGVRHEKPKPVGVYTPVAGSPERTALMNSLRGAVRDELGGEVVFLVRDLRSNGDWAFASVDPTWPDGGRINLNSTPIYRGSIKKSGLSSLRTEAIWRRQSGRWTLHDYRIGASDAWWIRQCSPALSGIAPGC